jgi:glycosyltransferase involved in cell wall biosynthesis
VTGERVVLHVLPHPGGGGETYVDALARIDGFRSERVYLAAGPDPGGARASILRRSVEIQRVARAHDVVHVHGEVASALCLPVLAACPSVVTLHGLNLLRRARGLAKTAARANLRLLVRAASRTICVSEAEHHELRSFLGERSLGRAVVVPNGVDPPDPVIAADRAAARAEFELEPSTVVGAWIGSLDRHKDPLTPIAAVSDVARAGATVALLVAGDGPLRREVERRSASTPVHVLGFRSDVRRVLMAADFFVLSSAREGLSFALLEAMALGLVPVVSDAPGNPEAVGDGGIVVPFADVGAFSNAFARLTSSDAQRAALGQRARERVIRRFRADEMRGRTRGVYEEVVLHRSGG